MIDNYTPPTYEAGEFHCPHCNTYAQQKWDSILFNGKYSGMIAGCSNCKNHTVWMDEKIYYPRTVSAPQAHEDMPEDIERDFEEARLVLGDSPRAAAALLRLGIQRLLEKHLEAKGSRIHEMIGNLVEEGEISPRIQKALDSVRITGNNSVHPGEMDMDDDKETATALFKLLNIIVDETIAREKNINEFYDSLPNGPKEGVKQRDGT